jgi:hypothetical protein
MKQVTFLGHVILKGGISVDPSKVQDVLSWKAPTSVGDIRSFLGLSGYYRRFLEGFSKIWRSRFLSIVMHLVKDLDVYSCKIATW